MYNYVHVLYKAKILFLPSRRAMVLKSGVLLGWISQSLNIYNSEHCNIVISSPLDHTSDVYTMYTCTKKLR